MTTYSVGITDEHTRVAIALKGALPPEFEQLGTFSYDIEKGTNEVGGSLHKDGEHVFITKAKEILDKKDISHKGITFEDKASNAPIYDVEGEVDEKKE